MRKTTMLGRVARNCKRKANYNATQAAHILMFGEKSKVGSSSVYAAEKKRSSKKD